ncbi:hypothetical protein [Aliiroseovarius subalbicans]|uniref:hypothetical protein n=1 Tax=Aliiroseovarius subalbicans TaxID=2925840 RepID=UPI001F58A104|nr:hypothetical protein [Aliiroseovarius subalbicans]MCI2399505.1 hypothetical protein [Aliiroseovarius subalbicans]
MKLLVTTKVQAAAHEVGITPNATSLSITINGEVIQIERIQDISEKLASEFT